MLMAVMLMLVRLASGARVNRSRVAESHQELLLRDLLLVCAVWFRREEVNSELSEAADTGGVSDRVIMSHAQAATADFAGCLLRAVVLVLVYCVLRIWAL